MAWDINRVVLVGRLSSDVDLRYTPGGTAVAKFGLAVGGKPKPDGSDSVSFFNIVVWGKSGENCSNFLSKGKQVCLEGRLEQRSWQAQDGTKRSTVEIIADRVEFIGPPSGASGGGHSGGGGAHKSTPVNNLPEDDYPMDDGFYDNTGFNQNPIDANLNDPGF